PLAIENIRLSEKAKDQLVKLKRYTGIKNWNVLCRWAFCLSLSESTRPAPNRIPADSNVEMTWRVFAGPYHELYLALLKQRCTKDGLALDETALNRQFRLHLHRGIGYLAADRELRSIAQLVQKAVVSAA
ncbi:unnamed protein product, partial [marine sediment metagenome]